VESLLLRLRSTFPIPLASAALAVLPFPASACGSSPGGSSRLNDRSLFDLSRAVCDSRFT
jgi:hypothetical protein